MGPWPTGKPDLMDEAAAAWRDLADALRAAWSDTQRNLAYVLSENNGKAARALEDTVQELTDPGSGSLSRALQASEQLQGACTNQADRIRNLKYQVENLIAQFAAMLAIDLAFAWLTFGTSVAAEAAIAEGLEAVLQRIILAFKDTVDELSETVATAIKNASKVSAKTIVGGTVGLSKAGASVPLSKIISEALGNKNAQGASTLKQILTNGLCYAAEGTLTGSAAVLSETLRNLAEQGGPNAARLLMLSRQLKSESITVEAANQAMQSMIQNHTITPSNYASAVIGGRLKTALAPHTGKHVRH